MTEEKLRDELPEEDVAYIIEGVKAGTITVAKLGSEVHVVFKEFQLPPDLYVPATTNLLVKLIPPYPNSNPDMFWTLPHVKRAGGAWPDRCEVFHVPAPSGHEAAYAGASWQQWSRHFPSTEWRPNIDNLRTYMARVRLELKKGR